MPGWVQQIADISGIHSWSCSDDVTILVMGYSGSNRQISDALLPNLGAAFHATFQLRSFQPAAISAR
jgi:hypothetical protein